jgi:hypothetical protein
MFRKIFSFSNATLLVALTLSTIAAWYSIIGLTAIFAGAVIPIIIMGSALELGKIVTTVWLRKYWYRCSLIMKMYLVPAVFFLAVLTSMGIFGFLSKAHMDQGIVSGDAVAKVSLYDEKIAIQRDIVKSSKSMLAQMDMQVNDIMTKGDSERSVERSVAIRKQQAKERANLQKDIENANKEIQSLNELRAPLAAETRKIEAEVGPIKYIAALIYGDNPDQNTLEAAVRWVIIMLVAVFDPLALVLVVAANQSKEWDENVDKELELKEEVEHEKVVADIEAERPVIIDVKPEEDLSEINHQLAEAAVVEEPFVEEAKVEEEGPIADKHPYLNQPFTHFTDTKPLVAEKPVDTTPSEEVVDEPKILAMGVDIVDRPGDYLPTDIPEIVELHIKQEDTGPNFEGVKVGNEWVQTGPELEVPEIKPPVFNGNYVDYDGKYMHRNIFASQYPDLFLRADGNRSSKTSFGIDFPVNSNTGDVFVRVDVYPNRVYKYNGARWIETSRDKSDTHLSPDYIEFLISKLATGEYDPELLTQNEQESIADHIKSKKG